MAVRVAGNKAVIYQEPGQVAVVSVDYPTEYPRPLRVTGDPGAVNTAAQQGSLSVRIGLGRAKSHTCITGQFPVMRYHRLLMTTILSDRAHITRAVNATVIPLSDAPRGTASSTAG